MEKHKPSNEDVKVRIKLIQTFRSLGLYDYDDFTFAMYEVGIRYHDTLKQIKD